MGVGRYENVGMKQTSCKTSVTSDGATSLTLDIVKHRDAVEMRKAADNIPWISALCAYTPRISLHTGGILIVEELVFMQSSFNMWCVAMT